MAAITVYRMEKDGKGPFLASVELIGIDETLREAYRTFAQHILQYLKTAGPLYDLCEPHDDGLGNLSWIYLFGCTTLSTLRTWFPPDLQDAAQLGFKIVARKVPVGEFKLGISRQQVAFIPSDDTPIVQELDIQAFMSQVDHPLLLKP